MSRNYFIWLILAAIASAILVVGYMWNGEKDASQEISSKIKETASEYAPRKKLPFASYISAVGIVEAGSENIYIGSPMNRIIEKVDVSIGQKVKKGEVLFKLEARDLSAELLSRRIAYENAKANLQKLEALPRAEDVAIAEAVLKSGQVDLEQAKSQYDRVVGLQNSGAMSQEEVNRRKFVYMEATAKYQQFQADYNKAKAGAWEPDLEIARLQVLQAKASMQQVETEMERTIIRSPIDGTVLQVKIHEGEFSSVDSARAPSMIIGNTDKMHLRVSVNQFDVSNYHQDATAVAFLQGDSQTEFPLRFVELEPVLVTKQNLTNDITEKVDTRVLQVVYAFKTENPRVFVGQLMDVFIENQHKLPESP